MSENSQDQNVERVVDEIHREIRTQEQDIAEEKEFREWMKGYTRHVHMTGKLLSALAKAMDKHPNLRLGQLIYAAIDKRDQKQGRKDADPLTYLRNFHLRIFNIHDEELLDAISDFDGDTTG